MSTTSTRKPSAAQRIAELEAQLAEANAAKEAAQAEAKAAVKKSTAGGYKDYETKEISPAIKLFMTWLAREFPETVKNAEDKEISRLVFLAIKTYGVFQKSDLGTKAVKAAKAAPAKPEPEAKPETESKPDAE